MNDTTWLDAWLDGAEVDDEQRSSLLRISDMVAERYPDDADDRGAAFTAAAQIVLGDTEWRDPVTAWREARRRELEAQAGMTGAVIAAVVYVGLSESRVATDLGLARMTVRKALGK